MSRAELWQQILGPFDRAGNQLRPEQNVKRINAGMSLSLLVAPVHLHRVTHRLEGVKREAEGQDQGKAWDGIAEMKERGQVAKVIVYEIVVFKNSQHSDVGHDARGQPECPPPAVRVFDEHAGEVIDED